MSDPKSPYPTLTEAREHFVATPSTGSAHTIESYARAIDLFLECLNDLPAGTGLPVLQYRSRARFDQFGPGDAPVIAYYAGWLKARSYAPRTIRSRVSGVQAWFSHADAHDWLPNFPLAKAERIASKALEKMRATSNGAPTPPDGITQAIRYYDDPPRPEFRSLEAQERWELIRLRNRALMHCLAETGGRISEVLSLNVGSVAGWSPDTVIRVTVSGKGGHNYDLRLFACLAPIRAYLLMRGVNLENPRASEPLFAVHSPTPSRDGARMTRKNADYVVRKAARALGLGRISPHDFRHWRATQLVNAGQPLDVVQDYLGHRSVETTRAYYAHTQAARVDEAARKVGLG